MSSILLWHVLGKHFPSESIEKILRLKKKKLKFKWGPWLVLFEKPKIQFRGENWSSIFVAFNGKTTASCCDMHWF